MAENGYFKAFNYDNEFVESKPFLYFTMQKIVKSLDSESCQNSYNCWNLKVF